VKKFITYLIIALILLAAALRYSLEFAGPQDTASAQLARVAIPRQAEGLPDPDSLRVYICGSASPLGISDRAQACVAILTPGHFYIVDSGAGSAARVAQGRLPVERLQGVLLTHHHSDHIAELYELNLASWVRGRPVPLLVYGPRGVRQIVAGVNDTYEFDRDYRIAHHGADLLPPALGELDFETIKPGVILEDGDMTITAYVADHTPVSLAVGYRFDYRGRSVVVSGDSLVTDETVKIVKGADLLLHDALSVPLVSGMAAAADKAGLPRLSKIMNDVLDYHASADSIRALAATSTITMVGLYHLVPVPQTFVMEKVFMRNMPEKVVLANDGDWFELPVNSREVLVTN